MEAIVSKCELFVCLFIILPYIHSYLYPENMAETVNLIHFFANQKTKASSQVNLVQSPVPSSEKGMWYYYTSK